MAARRTAGVGLVVNGAALAWGLALAAASIVAGGSPLLAGPLSGLALLVLVLALARRSASSVAVAIALLALAAAQADPTLAKPATAGFAIGLVVLAELAFLALERAPPQVALLAAGRVSAASAVVVAVVSVPSSVSIVSSAWLVPLGFAAACAAAAVLLFALRSATNED